MMDPDALTRAGAYPHPVNGVQLIETHMSWVYLTGQFAYKIKKAVQLDFVDLRQLQTRQQLCEVELTLNRRFVPELYLDVVAISRDGAGQLRVETSRTSDFPVVEWAVKMHQFDPQLQADNQLSGGHLQQAHLHHFGQSLARIHKTLPREDGDDPQQPILDNFDTLSTTLARSSRIDRLKRHAAQDLELLAPHLSDRAEGGFVRECHGDLHLGNMVLLDGELRAFDCLEFSQALRCIDVWADVAFLYMDLCQHDVPALAYTFVDAYLDSSGDYNGALLLGLYSRYRAMVRAKVAAIRYAQSRAADQLNVTSRYLDWALAQHGRPAGHIYLTYGLSGSGKSHWATQLVAALPALRIRADVLRKTSQGLDASARTHSEPGKGLYSAQVTQQLYRTMARLAAELALQGETVIVDATCLRRAQQQILQDALDSHGLQYTYLVFEAPQAVLLDRIRQRGQAQQDPSEADERILQLQIDAADALPEDIPAVHFDTTRLTLHGLLAALDR